MTPIADMIEAMLAENVSRETILLAVRTIELSSHVANDSRHDKDDMRRERDRMWRREKRANTQLLSGGAKANDVAHVVQMSSTTHDDIDDKRCDLSSSLLPVLL